MTIASIWLWQTVGKEVHFIDYVMGVGKGLDHWTSVLRKKAVEGGFEYRCHLLPHDIEAREISSAKSRRATLHRPDPAATSRSSPCRASARRRTRINAARRHARLGLFRRRQLQDSASPCCAATTSPRWASRCMGQGRTHTGPTPSRPPPSASTSSAASRPRCSGAAPCGARSGGSSSHHPALSQYAPLPGSLQPTRSSGA